MVSTEARGNGRLEEDVGVEGLRAAAAVSFCGRSLCHRYPLVRFAVATRRKSRMR